MAKRIVIHAATAAEANAAYLRGCELGIEVIQRFEPFDESQVIERLDGVIGSKEVVAAYKKHDIPEFKFPKPKAAEKDAK